MGMNRKDTDPYGGDRSHGDQSNDPDGIKGKAPRVRRIVGAQMIGGESGQNMSNL
jgi:hypothetical protein